jgi:TusE/DsrC/DsvC family sulfur relay protein
MAILEYAGKKVSVDDDGYLMNFDDWNEAIACALAEKEGVEELTKERMDILKFIRNYYREYHFFPIMNAVCRNVHQPRECISEKFIHPLLSWKLAGLPKPDELIINLLEFNQSPG